MRAFWYWFVDVLDWAVPRFLDEDVACELTGPDLYSPVVALSDVEPGERYDGIVRMRCFNFFGFACFPKPLGPVRPFVNPYG